MPAFPARGRSLFVPHVIQYPVKTKERTNPMIVTKDTIIGDVISADPNAAECFFMEGMFCVGCPASAGESIEEASAVHGIDCERLVERLNIFFGND
jgi:hybrid cluster-associated redox disulfide protein